MGLGVVVTLLLFVVLIIALVTIISSIERYTAFFKAIERIVSTIKYALYGSGVFIVGYGVYCVINIITSAASSGVFDPMIIAYAIGGYIVLAVIGWITEKVAMKIKERHTEYTSTTSVVGEMT